MKKDAVLINTARGNIVNEKDLYNEFLNNRLFVAFDVFWIEPYQGILTEFLDNRFFMSPHVASTNIDFLEGCKKDLHDLVSLLGYN